MQNHFALALVLFTVIACSNLKPTDQKEVCVDGVAMLHHPKTGAIKRVEYGGCTEDEQHSFYKEQVLPFIAEGYNDLGKLTAVDPENLEVRIMRYHQRTGNYPVSVNEIVALETPPPTRKTTSKTPARKSKPSKKR